MIDSIPQMRLLLSLKPVTSLYLVLVAIGILMLVLVIYLDKSEGFALKRDWRK